MYLTHPSLKRLDSYRIPIRERFNPILGKIRKHFVRDKHFTIISNNCWGAHVYRYFNLPYQSPTIGMYFYGDEYVKFISDLKHYCSYDLKIIRAEESRHYNYLKTQNNTNALIGVLDDVEIVLLHFHSPEEAIEKWRRRVDRINWDNIILKFSEQNYVTEEQLRQVDDMTFEKKIIFTSHDYGLKSQVIFKEWEGCPQIPDETTHFRRYVNLVNLVNGESFER